MRNVVALRHGEIFAGSKVGWEGQIDKRAAHLA